MDLTMLRAMGMVLHAGGGGQAEGRRTTVVTAEHPGSSTSNGEWGESSSRTMAEGIGGVGEGRQGLRRSGLGCCWCRWAEQAGSTAP